MGVQEWAGGLGAREMGGSMKGTEPGDRSGRMEGGKRKGEEVRAKEREPLTTLCRLRRGELEKLNTRVVAWSLGNEMPRVWWGDRTANVR